MSTALKLGESAVWLKAYELNTATHKMIRKFLNMEAIKLISELVTTSSNISENIAAACVCDNERQALSFVDVAIAKLDKYEQLLHTTQDLGYIDAVTKISVYQVWTQTLLMLQSTKFGKQPTKKTNLKVVK
jgi:four helix bundle protein